jgi:sarcosine oxidase, subunit beta
MPMTSPEPGITVPPEITLPKTADAVVVGGGTVGAWCACFLREAGLASVVLIEKGVLGQGASSRAAGVVRVQGGTPEAVRLGRWTREFYLGQRDWLGTDSGFVQQGYLLPAFTPAEVAAAHTRIEMQRSLGLPVRWLNPGEVSEINPTIADGATLGASYCAEDGYITPPRNVAAYTAALVSRGVVVAERMRFTALSGGSGGSGGSGPSVTVETSRGNVSAGLVVLAGGPRLAEVGAAAGITIPAGGVRHHVAVTEEHPAFADTPMVFDVPSGLYWRPEEGGLLFGMSDPDEPPGENRLISFEFLALMRSRLARLVPLTEGLGVRRAWAATIDFTPDHLPIIGPAPGYDAVFVASAGGAGMMWGPAVARVAADLAVHGSTSVVDVTDLGLDRFDASGRSRLAADPIALPFPEKAL